MDSKNVAPAAESAAGARMRIRKTGPLWYAQCPIRQETLAGRCYHEVSKGTRTFAGTLAWAVGHIAEHQAEAQ